MIEKTFSLSELKRAWGVYEKLKVLRVQVNGKWETRPIDSMNKLISGTHAAVKDLSDVMDFVEYLEEMWPKKTSTQMSK